jgi:hypothetical protein
VIRKGLKMKIRSVLAVALASASAMSLPARAENPCIVGSWRPDGNAMAAWMDAHLPRNARLPVVMSDSRLEIRADGTYSAWQSLEARMETNGRVVTGGLTASPTGVRSYTSTGRWRFEGSRLELAADTSTAANSVKLQTIAGPLSVFPGDPTRGRNLVYDVTCEGGRMQTKMAFPGMPDPVIQEYFRDGG